MSYKKWIHKYKFLQEDLIDTQKQFEEYAQIFNKDFSIKIDEDKPSEPIEIDPLPDRINDNLCKPIFKKLCRQ